jgi:hypothetical protein
MSKGPGRGAGRLQVGGHGPRLTEGNADRVLLICCAAAHGAKYRASPLMIGRPEGPDNRFASYLAD